MDAERWRRIERLYEAALAVEPARRPAFLHDASAAEPEVLREVEEMLAFQEQTGGFLNLPALEIALEQDGATTRELRRAFASVLARQATASSFRTAGVAFRLAPGARLGPYEMIEAVGSGGMGEIYRARDTRLDRTVAVKILAGPLMDQPGIRERFEAEARAISSLNHPNICTLYDIGRHDDIDYLVMEYLDGETLAQRLKHGPLAMAEVLAVAIEVSSALAYAHARGVIHRDLKPGNIILTAAGAKLVDFGLARWEQEAEILDAVLPASGDSSLTVTGLILGTPQYMAPEQIERRPVDKRTDIFAAGAVLYEMSTGRRAFEGATPAEVMRAILTEESPPISGGLGGVVRACLAKSPNERCQSASELARRLKQLTRAGDLPGRRTGRAVRTAAFVTLVAAVAGAAGDGGSAMRPKIRIRYDTKLEVLHSFPRQGETETRPVSLVPGPGATFYGTTGKGGDARAGTVFELGPPPTPGEAWEFRTLYTFHGGSDGADPVGPVIAGKHGEFYGVTAFGGMNGNGTVYELTPPPAGGGPWSEKVLHSFLRRDGDGCDPSGRLMLGDDGALYGTTQNGGIAGQGNGTVFRLIPPDWPGGVWHEEVLYRFTGGWDSGLPVTGLLQKDGELYGTTSWGTGFGGVYKLTRPESPGAEWKLTMLYKFLGNDGAGNAPAGDLSPGADGSLYGVSYGGGGLGAAFRMEPGRAAGQWRMAFLHNFTGANGDGANASGTVTFGPAGAIFGFTRNGGFADAGTIFELTPPKAPG